MIRTAHAGHAACWTLNAFRRGFRLNIGWLLAVEVVEGHVWAVMLDDAPRAAEFDPWRFDDTLFRNLPPHHFVVLPGPALVAQYDALVSACTSLAVTAATHGGTPYHQAWSPGMLVAIEELLGEDLPFPTWGGSRPATRWWQAAKDAPAPASDGPFPGNGVLVHEGGRLVGEARVRRVRDGRVELTDILPMEGTVPDAGDGWGRLTDDQVRAITGSTSLAAADFLPSEVAAITADVAASHAKYANVRLARQAFLGRFSPERLGALEGSTLLLEMHGRASRDSLVFWLEFKDDDIFHTRTFGSIAGGSSLKFQVYQSAEGPWVTGRSAKDMADVPEAEAVVIAVRQRDELLAAHRVLAALPDDPLDPAWREMPRLVAEAAPTVHHLAFAHKTLTLWHPERLDDTHSVALQAHLLVHLGVVPGETLYHNAALFKSLLDAVREQVPDADMVEVTAAMNARYGAQRGHWRIGCHDDQHDYWPSMRDESWVGVGWPKLGDLSDLVGLETAQSEARLRPMLEEHYPNTATQQTKNAKQITHLLVRMQEKDLVYVANGRKILGVGEVVGPYRFGDGGFPHRRSVKWLTTTPFQAPSNAGVQTTVHNLENATEIQAAARRVIAAAIPDEVIEVVPAKPRVPGEIEEQLERKGQVILYGPPGTGKTHHATLAAQEIVAHATYRRPWSALSTEERARLSGAAGEEGQRIWMCTFHPAFGYEDFVEGLRPVTKGGQLTFEPKDGLFLRICEAAAKHPNEKFVLIIDEFNRGDAPRIFGELLTLLEFDKRENATVTLPISGKPFKVPQKVLVIATMNTADRSITLLDAALRRRFGFLEYLPDPAVLGATVVEGTGIALADLLRRLNERLLDVLPDGRNRQIGHSYFLRAKNLRSLVVTLRYDVLPLLQDYCSDDPDLLERVVGDGIYDRANRRFRPDLFAPDGGDALVAALIKAFQLESRDAVE